MDEFMQIISNVGFPIAISAYLLIRIEGKLETLSISISQLARVVEILQNNNCQN